MSNTKSSASLSSTSFPTSVIKVWSRSPARASQCRLLRYGTFSHYCCSRTLKIVLHILEVANPMECSDIRKPPFGQIVPGSPEINRKFGERQLGNVFQTFIRRTNTYDKSEKPPSLPLKSPFLPSFYFNLCRHLFDYHVGRERQHSRQVGPMWSIYIQHMRGELEKLGY